MMQDDKGRELAESHIKFAKEKDEIADLKMTAQELKFLINDKQKAHDDLCDEMSR